MCVNSNRLKLLSLGLKRKVQCYNDYFINGDVIKTYNSEIYIKSSTFNEFEVEYYGNIEDVIEL